MSMSSVVLSLRLPIFRRHAFLGSVSILTGLLLLPALSLGQTFVQVNNNTVAANASSVSVTYTTPETAGNLNVVVVAGTILPPR